MLRADSQRKPGLGTAAPKVNARARSRSHAKADPAATAPKLDLGLAGRSRITATLGTIVVQFQSDSRLTNAWTNAITASNLGASSTLRQVNDTVRGIARAAILGKSTEKALNDYVNLLFPSLYSISSQGIVVGGQYANDIRILNNTIEGTMQGIHIGLSDAKANPYVSHLQAYLVQIAGNTIALRMTPEANFDRHGIYVGGVTSAWISNNNVIVMLGSGYTNFRFSLPVTAIRVVGLLGPRVWLRETSLTTSETDMTPALRPARRELTRRRRTSGVPRRTCLRQETRSAGLREWIIICPDVRRF